MNSEDYVRFEREYLDGQPGYANEGMPPLELLDRLGTEERAEAESRLIAQLSSRKHDFAWPAEGLAHLASTAAIPALLQAMRRARDVEKATLALAVLRISPPDAKRALHHLHGALGQVRGAGKAQLAAAIWRISGDDAMLNVLLELTRPFPHIRWIPRFLIPQGDYDTIQAIHVLGELLPHEAARGRLQELSDDRRMLVAWNARTVLLWHRLEQEGLSKEEIARRMAKGR